MRIFDFGLDPSNLGLTGDAKELDHKGTFERYLNVGLASYRQKGLDHKTRLTHLSLLRKLDASYTESLELEEAEFDLVISAFTKGLFDARDSRLIGLYVKAVEKAGKI